MNFPQLLTEHGAASLDKQYCLAEMIGKSGWQLNVTEGELTFGGRQTFPVQILGSEAEAAGTWLWSWANDGISPPPSALQAVTHLREYGEKNGLREFTEPELSLDQVGGHPLSMIASGLCEADAYYRGPYDGGAVFLLLSAPSVKKYADDSPLRFIRIVNDFLAEFPCDHRQSLLAYAKYKGYPVTKDGEAVVATLPQGAYVRAAFDEQGRLAEMTSTLTQENIGPQAAKKPWWKLSR